MILELPENVIIGQGQIKWQIYQFYTSCNTKQPQKSYHCLG